MIKDNTQTPGLIVFEGVDGAGKGVQSRALHEAMLAAEYPVILTREPGGSVSAEAIRKLIVEGDTERWDDISELLLIYAARRSHLQETILPNLEQGTWVISDRFADSSRAFQGFAGGLGLDLVEQVHEIVVGQFKPLLTLVLDIDPVLSLKRAEQRGGSEDRFEQKGLAYQQKVREGFLHIAQASPETHTVIDANQSIETVQATIKAAVQQRLGLNL
ncbi:dTMP kinase [Haliea sp. AH-315-K21]|uniref:Thymidylate kinase n=1 Tax=SAR86 cluster bacterium TaxID=2030880 RepID=A0A2A5CFG0_9GAMM|nr:dTMP kinase [Haliea sp. AH-315-K21]MBN4075867.1 dTMP kinase [Gammaproteobacteria bacterium AH-315-E17]PCJ42106.1 MAG: dTMP kinase [SAR86 cluster bacterium]